MSSSVPQSCCSRTAASFHYTPKGSYATIAGLNIYTTGPSDATRAILLIYDIFGLANQTLQGADILAKLTDSLVLVPDFFHGQPLEMDVLPADTEEKKLRFGKFFQEKADVTRTRDVALQVLAAALQQYPDVTSWGTFGLCWGGKITAMMSGPHSPFKAAGTCHPSGLDPKDAERMSIPYICLFSGEDGGQVPAYEEALNGNKCGKENFIEHFGDMHHGWMGARARLGEEKNKKEYERGYDMAGAFFRKNLYM